MATTHSQRATRSALTLIELLAVIVIVGLLFAILLPSIMAARESARRLHCSNHLKQIALGLNLYMNASGAFPGSMGVYSPLARILPFVGELPLYNSLNFNGSASNRTVTGTALEIFTCPSDSGPFRVGGMTNYVLNGGTANLGNAPFSWHPSLPSVGFEQITDGLSTTALASECLTGVPYRIRDSRRSVFQTEPAMIRPGEFPIFVDQCHGLDGVSARINGITKGASWATPGFGVTLYNHALTPDDHSCTNGTLTLQGAWTASSGHNGGVNVAFADGRVAYQTGAIGGALWLALGTMNGQEVTDVR